MSPASRRCRRIEAVPRRSGERRSKTVAAPAPRAVSGNTGSPPACTGRLRPQAAIGCFARRALVVPGGFGLASGATSGRFPGGLGGGLRTDLGTASEPHCTDSRPPCMTRR
ncbi:hypothetical protein A33M_3160 [Rhodovulum sp. PH10]|nr:hypothetical protein A33M_3160 [Rhodovulum sp. PH10]